MTEAVYVVARVAGYCPMGCGSTLVVDGAGRVVCAAGECPGPLVVTGMLMDPETEHVVHYGPEGLTLRHPLRERAGHGLVDCDLHVRLILLGMPPPDGPGRYRVVAVGDGLELTKQDIKEQL